jgi:hypothetical protein
MAWGSAGVARSLRPGLPPTTLPLAAALAALGAVAFARAAGGPGGLVLPLDDPYVYFVYARNTATGHPLAYNPGDPPTSGATSLLWTAFLAVACALGARGQAVVPAALALAAACLTAYLLLFALACRRAGADPWSALLAAAATGVYGRFAWGAFSGLEVPLSAVAVALFGAAATARAAPWPALVGAGLTLVRPDLGLAAVPAVLLWAAEDRRSRNLWALAPAAAALAWVLAWRALSGEPATNGVLVKTAFYAPGARLGLLVHHLPRDLALAVATLLTVRGRANAWGLALVACSLLGLGHRAGRAVWLLGAAHLTLVCLAFGPGASWIHHGRYTLPSLVAFELSAAMGLGALVRAARAPLWPLAAAALVAAAGTLPAGLEAYRRDSGEIRRQQVAAAAYIAARLPADAVILLNDAGAMNYFGGRYTLDIEGLGSDGFALPARSGTGAVYEHLLDYLQAHPALAARPLYFVVYPGWFPGIEAAFGDCPAAFTVPHPAILGGPTAVLCRANLPTAPPAGFRVADLDQDRRFAYSADPPGRTWLLRLPGPDRHPQTLAGRVVVGRESFTLPVLPHRDAELVAITTEPRPVDLTVHAGGRDLGPWHWPASPGAWETLRFPLPADVLTGSTLRVTLDGPERWTAVYRVEPGPA